MIGEFEKRVRNALKEARGYELPWRLQLDAADEVAARKAAREKASLFAIKSNKLLFSGRSVYRAYTSMIEVIGTDGRVKRIVLIE